MATRGNGNNETHEPGTRGYEKATVCAGDASKVKEALHKAEKPSQGSEAIVSMYKSSKQPGVTGRQVLKQVG